MTLCGCTVVYSDPQVSLVDGRLGGLQTPQSLTACSCLSSVCRETSGTESRELDPWVAG